MLAGRSRTDNCSRVDHTIEATCSSWVAQAAAAESLTVPSVWFCHREIASTLQRPWLRMDSDQSWRVTPDGIRSARAGGRRTEGFAAQGRGRRDLPRNRRSRKLGSSRGVRRLPGILRQDVRSECASISERHADDEDLPPDITAPPCGLGWRLGAHRLHRSITRRSFRKSSIPGLAA